MLKKAGLGDLLSGVFMYMQFPPSLFALHKASSALFSKSSKSNFSARVTLWIP